VRLDASQSAYFGASTPSTASLLLRLARGECDLPLSKSLKSAILPLKPPGIWQMSIQNFYKAILSGLRTRTSEIQAVENHLIQEPVWKTQNGQRIL
jgi:hypothetical protein